MSSTTIQDQKENSVQIGNTYTDERYTSTNNEKQVTVIHTDQKTTLLEDNTGRRLLESTEQFKEGIGKRWKLQSNSSEYDEESQNDPDNDIEGNRDKHKKNNADKNDIRRSLEILRLRAEHNTPHGSIVSSHIDDYVSALSEHPFEPMDFTDVNGVGRQTDENIKRRNIKTRIDTLLVPIDVLTDIKGVGETTAKRIKDMAEEES